ncbi:MAG TPA: septum formation initiator family protein [Candidatus Copromorpha excrementigallinarum]|uniref:Septum formation initiator family protein n=1 Tax=Candidatus Allocopromorpha excrementigallinarum TaxID=2840742 RepID=A0A9D1HZV2_9FIRM|nr:septum formation initiator family protein [Candidatus Copromorpha excrementigallinarum]
MVGIIVVLIAGTVGFSIFNVISLKKEQHDTLAQQEELKAEKQELEEQLEEINAPENIEEEARNQLRLIMPGETLYMFPEEITENRGNSSGSNSGE